jgi:SM-20-related protein
MWLNDARITDSAISAYQKALTSACPRHIVIDHLFDATKLNEVVDILQQSQAWQTQKHTYSILYADNTQWQKTREKSRFVQRDIWQRQAVGGASSNSCTAREFLEFLRDDEFLALLSRIYRVTLTDKNVADPDINTNYFRLGPEDFVKQHADDSPAREVCMLLYLNKNWDSNAGGEITFTGMLEEKIRYAPVFNRCILFDPASKGAEHWVQRLNPAYTCAYRYNVTSWYWTQ